LVKHAKLFSESGIDFKKVLPGFCFLVVAKGLKMCYITYII